MNQFTLGDRLLLAAFAMRLAGLPAEDVLAVGEAADLLRADLPKGSYSAIPYELESTANEQDGELRQSGIEE